MTHRLQLLSVMLVTFLVLVLAEELSVQGDFPNSGMAAAFGALPTMLVGGRLMLLMVMFGMITLAVFVHRRMRK